MAWNQLILTFNNRDWLEPVSDFFVGMGASAAEIDGREPRVIVLFPLSADLEPALAQFSIFLESLGIPEPRRKLVTLPDTDWVAVFRKHFQPFRMNQYLHVIPAWETAGTHREPGVLVVDPGQAFGTGLHATTALAAELVWESVHAKPTRHVLDVGCGTGILSIVAMKRGAGQVTALDIDPLCSTAIHRHMELNGITTRDMFPFIGSVDALRPIGYDLIIINIIETVIRSLLPSLIPMTNDRIVLSGILTDATDSFCSYLATHGLQVEHMRTRDEWTAILCRRSQ